MEVDNEQTNEPQRVQDLWFEDGNLVIQAGNSQCRVYRGVLATRSLVFQDMLSFPQPSDSELVDGCPLVGLTDTEEEVIPFLKAIFLPEFFMPFPAPTEFDAIVGCLRLSHKYAVDYLRRRALVHLSSGHAMKLSDADKLYYLGDRKPSWSVPPDPTFRIRGIQLAREVEATWILPYAFYELVVHFDELGAAIFNGGNQTGPLSVQDQESFLKGHDSQTKSSITDAIRFLWRPFDIPGCDNSSECHVRRLAAMECSRNSFIIGTSYFLYIWNEDDWESLRNLCSTCLRVLRKTHEDARQAFWDNLPGIYGLPSWAELEQMKASAIGADVF
ncbi:hypothetical protein B0H14DRAFT_2808292, partial [Mycena olivaceomarginata]